MKSLLLILILAANALAIPQLVNYQGQLTSTTGTPLDTTVAMTFKIWPTPTGGSPNWTESHAAVVVANGLFNVQLGSITALPDSFAVNRWLGITVGNNTEMIPREQLTSVAHAYRVGTVDGASGGTISGKLNVGQGNSNAGTLANVYGENNSADGNNSTVSGGQFNSASQSLTTIGGGFGNIASGSKATVGGGEVNLAGGPQSTISGGTGNEAPGASATVCGGSSNVASGLLSIVGGGVLNNAHGDFSFVGSGYRNSARGDFSFVGGGGGDSGADSNSAQGQNSAIVGGAQNNALGLYSFIGGGGENFLEGAYSTISGGNSNTTSNGYSIVAGGYANTASGTYTTIGGGANNDATGFIGTISGGIQNSAIGDGSSVGGGGGNHARGLCSVIAGGGTIASLADSNSARGTASTIGGGRQQNITSSAPFAFIGGGFNNLANDSNVTISGGRNNGSGGKYASIGGGDDNAANGAWATVGGGFDNSASASYATVPGGNSNVASGQYSFAAGRLARADNTGSFVWSSGGDTTFANGNNTFSARCHGGARFYTATGTGTGVSLSAGGGSWNSLCDVNQKRLHGTVNTADVLNKISSLPLYRWSYKSQSEDIQHIGPTAQDFYASFGLGDNNTTISTLDPDGVALAAIQELANENKELKTQIHELLGRVQTLEADQKQTISLTRRNNP